MSENLDEILSNFQECTGIANIQEAITCLQNFKWNLVEALKYALPQQSRMTTKNPENESTGMEPMSNISGYLEFRIHFSTTVFKLRVPDHIEVSCLKSLIFCEVGSSELFITGWPCSQEPSDTDILSTLGMPSLTNLYLVSHVSNPFQSHEFKAPMSINNYSLNCHKLADLRVYDGLNNREYCIKLFFNKTVGEFKEYVYGLTEIPVDKQIWCGWPSCVTDELKLFQLNLDTPYHCLLVQCSTLYQNNLTCSLPPSFSDHISAPLLTGMMESESSFPDLEDSSGVFVPDDAVFEDHDERDPRRSNSLIPPDVPDEITGSEYFVDGYLLRYGERSPNFFPGTLDDVLREACFKPARERRMLAIYIHHDSSILSNVFCTEILGSEAVLEYFRHYFLLWGWDVTNESNRNLLLNSFRNSLGFRVADAIQNMEVEQFPTVLVVSRSRGNTEILNIINGNIGVNEFIENLIRAIDVFTNTQEAEIIEEDARAARERIKIEQDQAYRESLEKDRAKDEARKQHLLSKMQEEERLKKLKEEEAVRRRAERREVASKLPAEPNNRESVRSEIVTFRFRAPGGVMFERKFLQNQQLQVVFDYLLVKGYRIEEYKLISVWPRRDLTTLESRTSLEELNLCPQETVILEKR